MDPRDRLVSLVLVLLTAAATVLAGAAASASGEPGPNYARTYLFWAIVCLGAIIVLAVAVYVLPTALPRLRAKVEESKGALSHENG